MEPRSRSLSRRPTDGMVGGICSGIAHHYDVDVALVRAAFVGALVFNGLGAVVYLVLWYFLDPTPPDPVLADEPMMETSIVAPTEPATAELDDLAENGDVTRSEMPAQPATKHDRSDT